MHRNDALDNIELLATELNYLLSAENSDTDNADALQFHDKALAAFVAYLALAPDDDKLAAYKLLQDEDALPRSGPRS